MGKVEQENTLTRFDIGVNVVVICPDRKLRNTLIRAIEATCGIKPVLKSDSESAKRAHYAPAISKLIINTAALAMHQRLGRHSIALAIETISPGEAAYNARDIFQAAGYDAFVDTRAEPEFPDGFIPFVVVPALNGIVLMFWPKTVSPEVAATLPKRLPWTDKDAN